MRRSLAGLFIGSCAIVCLNSALLLFTPVGGMPLEGPTFFSHRMFAAFCFLFWAAAAVGTSLLICRVAGRLEGLVSLGAVVLATATLVGLLPAFVDSVAVANLQLGSIILSVPLLFIFFVGGVVSFFVRRPDMV